MDCRQELCPNWPGQGCLSGILDCQEPEGAEDVVPVCLYCADPAVFEISADGPTEHACVDHTGAVLVDLSDMYPSAHLSATRLNPED